MFCQNLRFQGPASLRAAEHTSGLRADAAVRESLGGMDGGTASRPDPFRHGQIGADWKGIRRLEPKRTLQVDGLRLFLAGKKGATTGVIPDRMG